MMRVHSLSSPSERGGVLVTGLILVVTLMGLSAAILSITLGSSSERTASVAGSRALYCANSGLSHVIANLIAGEERDVGAADAQVGFAGGSYWASVVDNGDRTFTVTSTGSVGFRNQAIEAVVTPIVGGVFNNAVFAGNSDDDPLYTLELGGIAGQSDFIEGDIYSGGDVRLRDDAQVTGMIRATGVVDGGPGETDVRQPVPDLPAMSYETSSDFDVAALFAAATYESDEAGGSAWQVEEDSPAHIFRRNPSDRTRETDATAKDDYFLEDPYEEVRSDSDQDGTDAYQLTFSGVSGAQGPDSNQKVFFVDGNLWLHNKEAYSFKLNHDEPNGVQVTFVVKGNIYFSDNIFYDDMDQDGLAFIAMKDPDVPNSGNIFLGDPEFGTLRRMYGLMYAENNFYDVNLEEDGSSIVELHGNMTAGNKVVIERDFELTLEDERVEVRHTKLIVDFDDRVAKGEIEIPGLPAGSLGQTRAFRVLSWRKVAAP